MPYVATLNESDLKFGQQVTEQLKAHGVSFDGVFWLYDEDADDWRLVIATSLVDQVGWKETYLRLAQIVSTVPRSDLQVMGITAMSLQTPLFAALRKAFATAAHVEGTRLQHTTVNGVLVPAAYLYEIR